jgi:uncharacterized protein YkwD
MYSLWEQGEDFDVYFSHDSPEHGYVYDLIRSFGHSTGGSENLAHHAYYEEMSVESRAKRSIKRWKNSPGHYQNMIDPQWTHVGFGLTYYYEASNKQGYFLLTQTFLK